MLRKLVVNGSNNDVSATATDFDNFQLVQSITVSNTRSPATRQEIEVQNEDDIVEIHFEDGSTWIGNATEFHEIFNIDVQRGFDEDSFEVPTVLQSTTDRNVVQDLAISVFNFFKRKPVQVIDNSIHELAKKLEDKIQPQPGLYLLDSGFRKKIAGQLRDTGKPYLLFIHGTNSNTEGAFGDLVAYKQFGLWNFITGTYGENILTWDHKTFTQSPLENVIDLLQQLPAGITLHLITHSRGGLVGDIVARASSVNTNIGFTDAELALFADGSNEKQCMQKINLLAKEKNIAVQKFIRVASPSMGTSLLCDRIDHYLNTLLNFIGISTGVIANPVYAGVKALVAEVAATKAKVDVLPGIAAMVPESPFIKMLNNPANIIEAPLTVLSGNCTVQFELKALLVILTKLYFRRKNDMVVDTWSMYFGTPRKKDIWFYLDDAKGTDHIHYFRSQNSQEAITRALKADTDIIPGFKTLQEADLADANRNAALPFITPELKLPAEKITGTKPIAIIMPGIMGSNLYVEDDKVWIDFWSFVKGDLAKLGIDAADVTAPSLMGSGYRKLAIYLSKQYEIVAFGYDWRKPLEEAVKIFDDTIKLLLTKQQPIHVIAHSMGGVLFRQFMIEGTQWNALNATTGFRTVFLGAPLGGSYLIPEALCGRGGNISKLSIIDLKHNKKDLLQIFSQYPGMYNLLPLSNTPHDFSKSSTWQEIFSNSQNIGSLPSQKILDGYVRFRDKVLNNRDDLDYRNIVYIAGKSDATTATYEIENTGRDNGLVFKSTEEGDGSVTWASGIPDQLAQRNAVYYCNTEHGELANDPDIFGAITELLQTGSTNLLNKTAPVSRGTSKLKDNPKYELVPVDAGNIEKVVLGIKEKEKAVSTAAPLKITMSNGDLGSAQYPILVGHFYKDGIMSAEKMLDTCFNGLIHAKHTLGLYPGSVGTSEIFLSSSASPKGGLVVGLGELGELNGYQLELSVTQGVSRYLLEVKELEASNKTEFNKLFPAAIGISPLIVGCGYGGLSIESSIKAIILGIKKANESIQSLSNAAIRQVEYVEFVELYEDRSLQAFYTLKKLEADQQLNIVLPSNKIKKLQGSRKRVPLDYQQDWWQRVSVSVETEPEYYLKFSASTGSAREEVRNLNSNPTIIQHFIDKISGDDQWSPQLAKTVFELLVPNDFKDAVRNQYNILWKLDKYSAAFPWELLQDTATQTKPLCVNAGMIRQLATADYRTQIKRSYANNALVIGDPDLEGFVHQLPGAAEEAKKAAEIISNNEYKVNCKIKKTFEENLQALFENEYKIIHLAGHGFFETKKEEKNDLLPEGGGMVIGNGIFLTPREINQMSLVPEFVFINCCFLGKVNGVEETLSQQRYKLAANLGVQLIEMGVKAVIAAGWAVNDDAALLFSEVFYKEMFAGAAFGEAVQAARSQCFNKFPNTNTWGAYQCYGDQFYKFTIQAVAKNRQYNYVIQMEAEIDLNNLYNKAIAGRHTQDAMMEELKAISTAIDKSAVRTGALTELEARILIKMNMATNAIDKIKSMLNTEQADYTVSMLDNLYELNIKSTMQLPEKTEEDVKEIISNFAYLMQIGDTAQRHILLGSAYRILFSKSNKPTEKTDALKKAAAEYKAAFEIAKKNNAGAIDALCTWVQLESLLIATAKANNNIGWGKSSSNKYKLPAAKTVIGWLDKLLNNDLDPEKDYDFWDMLNHSNVLLAKLCMGGTSVVKEADILASIKNEWTSNAAKAKLNNGIGYLNMLINGCTISTNTKAKSLANALKKLQGMLSKEAA